MLNVVSHQDDGESLTQFKESEMGFWRIVFTIILPPLGVLLDKGIGGAFLLNIILTLLGYIPGLIHAFWIQTRN